MSDTAICQDCGWTGPEEATSDEDGCPRCGSGNVEFEWE